MIYVKLPDNAPHPLPFYLAVEEYVARRLPPADYFFMWQVKPSVIFGRNQVAQREVNIPYCTEHDIDMWRRKSGGGCVYADMGNVMLSYITHSEKVTFTFNHYISMLTFVLGKMGIEATATGRNDVLIGGKKVSGNAFYHLPGRSIVHGTLLYDTHMQHMMAAITPPADKLSSKGVDSVRQHITTLKEHTNLSLEQIKTLIRQTLCNESITLTKEDIQHVSQIENEYHSTDFIFGNNPRFNATHRQLIEGVGDIEVHMAVKGNRIEDINLTGDFFLVGDVESSIIKPLKGCELTRQALDEALPDNIGETILKLDKEQFITLILQTPT